MIPEALTIPCYQANVFGLLYQIYFLMSLVCAIELNMITNERQAKRRGPPATGKGLLVGVRLQPPQLKALDAWVADQPKKMSRPEAVRQILAKTIGTK